MRKLGDRLRALFGRNTPTADQQSPPAVKDQAGPLAEMLQQRVRRVSESLLENERLTADLDDSAAQVLLDWALNLGSQIARGTVHVQDDQQADEAMYPRLRATRRMMHSVNHWVTSEQERDQLGSREALNQIFEQAEVIYGQTFAPPSEEQRAQFLRAQAKFLDNPPQMIANLKKLFADDNDA